MGGNDEYISHKQKVRQIIVEQTDELVNLIRVVIMDHVSDAIETSIDLQNAKEKFVDWIMTRHGM